MIHISTDISQEEFVRWAIEERKNRSRLGQATIDVRMALLYRGGRISEALYKQYASSCGNPFEEIAN